MLLYLGIHIYNLFFRLYWIYQVLSEPVWHFDLSENMLMSDLLHEHTFSEALIVYLSS